MEAIHNDFRRGEEITGCLLKLLLGIILCGLLSIFLFGLLLGLYLAGSL